MKIILFVFFGFLQQICYSQNVRIPDPAFKQKVIALGYDTNDDGQIQVSEAQQVTKLYFNNLGIVNMEGINSFTNLEELGCYNNKLDALNVSKLKNLKYLYANNNRISNLKYNGLDESGTFVCSRKLFFSDARCIKIYET